MFLCTGVYFSFRGRKGCPGKKEKVLVLTGEKMKVLEDRS
jgi:hypothetical protein